MPLPDAPRGAPHRGTCTHHGPLLPQVAVPTGHPQPGKKYRLEQPLPSVLPRLEEGLTQYVDYKMRSHRGDADYAAALEKWAAAVMAKAQARLQAAAVAQHPAPDGYPGLREQIKAAQNALVFGPEDRAPHAFFYACGRLDASKLDYRLMDSGAFMQETRDRYEVLQEIAEFNESLQLQHHKCLPYLYGGWKAKKQAFRWIAGTSRVQDDNPSSQEADQPTEEGAPKNALSEVGKVMVKVLQQVLRALRTKDNERRGQGLPPRYWVVEDIDEFVQEYRAAAATLAKYPWATYDFTTMYEALQHGRLLEGCMQAALEAWEFMEQRFAAQQGLDRTQAKLCLGATGWMESKKIPPEATKQWFSPDTLKATLHFMLNHLFMYNGGVLRRQVQGLPMGLECSPQLANAYGYAIEAKWVDEGGQPGPLARRFIDDIIVAGPNALNPGAGLPSEEQYGMQYKRTSTEPNNLVYLGVRLFVDERGEAHSVLHDRAVDYPIRVDRYPEGTTVANPAQLGGVIMGRLVAAQRTCSRLDLFQDAVAGIFTHAHRRRYPRRLVHSVWTRFLVTYWDAASVTTKELRRWFHEAWNAITTGEGKRSTPRHEKPLDRKGKERASASNSQALACEVPPHLSQCTLADLVALQDTSTSSHSVPFQQFRCPESPFASQNSIFSDRREEADLPPRQPTDRVEEPPRWPASSANRAAMDQTIGLSPLEARVAPATSSGPSSQGVHVHLVEDDETAVVPATQPSQPSIGNAMAPSQASAGAGASNVPRMLAVGPSTTASHPGPADQPAPEDTITTATSSSSTEIRTSNIPTSQRAPGAPTGVAPAIREVHTERHYTIPVYLDRPVFIERPVIVDRPVPYPVPVPVDRPAPYPVPVPVHIPVHLPTSLNVGI